ncbi:hypothetical protein [Devosia chinhatensis]|uniref:hypothetical protein n=1 Tax=Devosia chinhatensis TaxID=429727 RepID=UPI000A85269F|nr:hypothetical protein [Devosia chinhatensis]
MRFAVVNENREWSEPGSARNGGRAVHPLEIEAEARRRKACLGLDEWRLREYVTGEPIPARIHQMCQQIDLAARALSGMSSAPTDFRDDVYWPRSW